MAAWERDGDTRTATRLFSDALATAKTARCAQELAECSLQFFRLIAEQRSEQGGPTVLQVRNAVISAGDPHLSALLHESVARVEAQRGNLWEARRHLSVAQQLVEVYPNAWLQQLCDVNAFCISFLTGDVSGARGHLNKAKRLTATTGSMADVIANNEAHVLIQLGRFDDAADNLRISAASGISVVRRAALDGLARLQFAKGELDNCEKTLQRLEALFGADQHYTTFPLRLSFVTRIRVLLQRGQWDIALDTVNKAIDESVSVKDVLLAPVLRMLQAYAFRGRGDWHQCSAALMQAAMTELHTTRSQFEFLLGDCASVLQPHKLSAQERRAWTASPLASSSKKQLSSHNTGREADAAPQVHEIVNRVASVIASGYSSRALGEHLSAAIRELGCSPGTEIVGTRPSLHSGESGKRWLRLSAAADAPLYLTCKVPVDPFSAVTLADVLRIGHAAVALERARQQERSRAALWPPAPVEEQAGALFLAEEMQALLATARRIAPTTVPVLITGETGTGKEVLARMIHAYSPRVAKPFIPFNCSATPKEMLDSQLFGHRRGAFTGASDHFPGVIRAAAGGTLFLDEIGETTLDLQPKLLRFLESSEVHPIGETQPVRVDVRIVAATNADLDTLVAERRFREDLFYRLNIVRLHLPPLRERRVEIPALAHHYLQKHGQECGKADLRLAEETMEYLVLYRWPGNVRQLANEMRRLAALAEPGAVLMPEHLSPEIAASRRTIPASERTLDATEVVVRMDQPMSAATQHLERAMLQHALRKAGGRIEETAALLGLSRKGLYLKRLRYGLEPPEGRAAEVA